MIALSQCQDLIADIEWARRHDATLAAACAELGVSARTLERWKQDGMVRADGRPDAVRPGMAWQDFQDQAVQRAPCHAAMVRNAPCHAHNFSVTDTFSIW